MLGTVLGMTGSSSGVEMDNIAGRVRTGRAEILDPANGIPGPRRKPCQRRPAFELRYGSSESRDDFLKLQADMQTSVPPTGQRIAPSGGGTLLTDPAGPNDRVVVRFDDRFDG
jgi:hypothetical protein